MNAKTDSTLQVVDLTRSYGSLTALDSVSFTAEAGRVLGLLGPNGAGKTTLLCSIAGAIVPDDGRIGIDGVWSSDEGPEWRARIGFVPEESPAFTHMSVREYLGFLAGVMGFERTERAARIESALTTCSLTDVAERRYEHLSKGFRRRTCLAGALVSRARVILLDEPTSGLDPQQREDFSRLVRALADNRVVVFSSHSIPDIEGVCDDILVLNKGSVVAAGSVDDLLTTEDRVLFLKIDLTGRAPFADSVLKQAPFRVRSSSVRGKEQLIEFVLQAEEKQQELIAWAVAHEMPIAELRTARESLAELYRGLTGQKNADEAGEEGL
ncbi:MAG: ABC transporter ATP-binding protein [Spirochaetaceae bacterium]|nr:MAG: ABC transporter ATP-binding protein [Spirochaetaceae bacterium]